MKHVVLIDDDMFIRDLVATKLSSEHYSVATAATGDEGLRMVAEKKPDLVLLDLDLPDRHGLEILKEIKTGTDSSSVPVIIFSNNDAPEMRDKVAAAGASDFYIKVTIDMSELAAKLKKFLNE